jgi:outer membrane lipoprotein-sorting protein
MKKLAIILVMTVLLLAKNAQAQITPGVDEIVQKSNHAALYPGKDFKGKVSMVITDNQGRMRKREFRMLRLDVGEDDLDQKYFVFFKEPADVRKMVFIVHKNAAKNNDDTRWLYLPSLDLVKRIASSDKRTSFAGSDFLYEDISGRNPAEDTHELVTSSQERYVLKNTPKKTADVEFAYYLAYINKTTFLPEKIEFFNVSNTVFREIEVTQIQNLMAEENNRTITFPTVIKTVARNLLSGSQTEMTISEVAYNTGIREDIFSERYLRNPPKEILK